MTQAVWVVKIHIPAQDPGSSFRIRPQETIYAGAIPARLDLEWGILEPEVGRMPFGTAQLNF